MKISSNETLYAASARNRHLDICETSQLDEHLFLYSLGDMPQMIIRAPDLEEAYDMVLDNLLPLAEYDIPDAYGITLYPSTKEDWIVYDETGVLTYADSEEDAFNKAIEIIADTNRPLAKGYHYQPTPEETGIVYSDLIYDSIEPLTCDLVDEHDLKLDIREI